MSQASCNIGNRDCSCADASFAGCSESGAAQNAIHTKNLEECIFQCKVAAYVDMMKHLLHLKVLTTEYIWIINETIWYHKSWVTICHPMFPLPYFAAFLHLFFPLQLFHTYGTCDYLLFYKSGPNQNCHLFYGAESLVLEVGLHTIQLWNLQTAGLSADLREVWAAPLQRQQWLLLRPTGWIFTSSWF